MTGRPPRPDGGWQAAREQPCVSVSASTVKHNRKIDATIPGRPAPPHPPSPGCRAEESKLPLASQAPFPRPPLGLPYVLAPWVFHWNWARITSRLDAGVLFFIIHLSCSSFWIKIQYLQEVLKNITSGSMIFVQTRQSSPFVLQKQRSKLQCTILIYNWKCVCMKYVPMCTTHKFCICMHICIYNAHISYRTYMFYVYICIWYICKTHTHSKSTMSVPNVGLQNKGKSEVRMESNLVTIGCLKREEEIVFLKAKKKFLLGSSSRMLLITTQDKKPQLKWIIRKVKKKNEAKHADCKPIDIHFHTRHLDSTKGV